jgi:NAD(P)-dependent dehydrogenase (short-subunit alcohol dehydrogenase family)
MSDRFSGKKVFVTGGARGIGMVTARALHDEGATVVVGARTKRSVDAFLNQYGDERFTGVAGDLSCRESCHQVVDQALQNLGGLDVLVNSAGVFEDVAFESVTQTHWNETLGVNLAGVFFCCQAAMPSLVESCGNIVNVASDAGLIAYTPAPTYGASKAGVVNLTKTLAYEYAKSVRVNCVCPGNVETDMLIQSADTTPDLQRYLAAARARAPLARMAMPTEIAEAILYFASDKAGFTTGVALPMDGGGMLGY